MNPVDVTNGGRLTVKFVLFLYADDRLRNSFGQCSTVSGTIHTMRSMTLLCWRTSMPVLLTIVTAVHVLNGPTPAQDAFTGRPAINENPQSDVLEPLVRETPTPKYDSPVPALVSGRVVLRSGEGKSGAEGVPVTDGYSVVRTDAQGNYTLRPSRDSVFVYITRPSGHDVRGNWYKPLADRVDFEVQVAPHSEEDYIFVHVTDTHVSANLRSHQGLSRFVREVNALSPRPCFVVNSGDLLGGSDAEDWGDFIAGDAEPPDESPFHRRQSVFCFLLRPGE